MKVGIDELERKASAATPGPWTAGDCPDDGEVCDVPTGKYVVARIGRGPVGSNAMYIAAASPPVVLALIARIRELESFMRACAAAGLQAEKVYRDEYPSLFAEDDGNALYMDDASKRILERGVVLP